VLGCQQRARKGQSRRLTSDARLRDELLFTWDTETALRDIRSWEMKAIEAIGTIEQERRVLLDEPLPAGVSGRVRLLILIGDDELNDRDWMRAAMQGGSFDFLNAPEEDIYTLKDGKPFDDAR
jgi:hypothetical protein